MLELLTLLVILSEVPHETSKLTVTCDKITVSYKEQKPSANKIPVTFWMKDRAGNNWKYTIPMETDRAGKIILEPVEFWLEEIRTKKKLKLSLDRYDYHIFNLQGTYSKINCD